MQEPRLSKECNSGEISGAAKRFCIPQIRHICLRYLRRFAALKIVSSLTSSRRLFLSHAATSLRSVQLGKMIMLGTPLGQSDGEQCALAFRRALAAAAWGIVRRPGNKRKRREEMILAQDRRLKRCSISSCAPSSWGRADHQLTPSYPARSLSR